jgi:tRNA pseudouridine55 synthase
VARRNKKGRPINGIIVIDKPTGRSSNHVLQQVKRLFNAQKAGHTGSLDPLATGLLPVCLGDATRISSYLLDADKSYRVECQLGVVTDSGDSDGNVIAESPVPEIEQVQIETIIEGFVGEQDQVPPMYSALKHQGQPLYKLARQGIEIERKARRVTIYDIKLVNLTSDTLCFDVTCSKGTYIRSLIEDIGQKNWLWGSCHHATQNFGCRL